MSSLNVETTWKARLFHLFQNSPHITALIEVLSDSFQDTVDVCDFITDHLGIDDAEGETLDLLGEIIGIVRPKEQEDPSNIFTFCELGEVSNQNESNCFRDSSGDDTDCVTGGYLTSYYGIPDQSDPTSTMSDDRFRYLIKQKAACYRKKMTNEILFNYLLAFGSRCNIESETRKVWIDPLSYYDLDDWEKWYVENKGFKPVGTKIKFIDNIRKVEI